VLRSWFGILCAIGLAGCAAHPLPEDYSQKSTSEIVRAIRCEAKEAIVKYASDPRYQRIYDQGAIGYEFNFNILEQNDASASTSFERSFSSISKFTLGLGGTGTAGTGAELKRQAIRKFSIADHFGELRKLPCGGTADGLRLLYPITGQIGLAEVIQTFIDLEQAGALAADQDQSEKGIVGGTVDFSEDLQFTTSLNTGALTPALVLAPVSSALRMTNLGGTFSASRTDTHQVTVALAMPPLPKIVQNANLQRAGKQRPAVGGGAFSSGVSSKVALATEPSSKAKVLYILDRRRVLGQNDDLIRAIGNLRAP
jgi:hypothetical protein